VNKLSHQKTSGKAIAVPDMAPTWVANPFHWYTRLENPVECLKSAQKYDQLVKANTHLVNFTPACLPPARLSVRYSMVCVYAQPTR
jgi:hypothetical protein